MASDVFTVEVSKGKGAYKVRYSGTEETMIHYFNCINVHSGYNKRIRQNGRTIARVMT